MRVSPDCVIRRLASADVAFLKALSCAFGDAFDDADTYAGAVPEDAYLAQLLEKEHFIAIAAMTGGQVVGGLVAYVLDKFERDRREIYIYDLAVREAYRRKGIASGLIRELERIAAERGAYVIFVQADPEDGPAIALYQSFGKKTTAHHFDIEVPRRKPRPP